MQTHIHVAVRQLHPEEGYAILEIGDDIFNDGLAREDGTFAKPSDPDFLYDTLRFVNADDAIAWAQSPPRHWTVINTFEVGNQRIRLPERVTIRVREVVQDRLTHKALLPRIERGEELIQIRVSYDLISTQPPDQPFPPQISRLAVVIDHPAVQRMAAVGIKTFQDAAGRIFTLAPLNRDDALSPFDLVEVQAQSADLTDDDLVNQTQAFIEKGELEKAEAFLNTYGDGPGKITKLATAWGMDMVNAKHGFAMLFGDLGDAYLERGDKAIEEQQLARAPGHAANAERCYERAWDLYEVSYQRASVLPHLYDNHFRLLIGLAYSKFMLEKYVECKSILKACLALSVSDDYQRHANQRARHLLQILG